MATSGTTAFNPDLTEIVEEAYELAGVEGRSGYQLRSALRSIDFLMIEWANRGYNLWTVESASFTATDGTASYALPATIVDAIEVYVTISGTDYIMTRLGDREYMSLSNKAMESRPTSYWMQRTATPTMHLWPVPDQTYTINYWRMRRIEDTGAAGNTMDMPYRFLPALVAGLAVKLAAKSPGMEQRVPYLDGEYEKQFNLATEEDRVKTSFYVRGK